VALFLTHYYPPMETGINNLSVTEKEILFAAPALVTLLTAMDEEGNIDEESLTEAVKLAHWRTFTSAPILTDYYVEADKRFEENVRKIREQLPEKEKRTEFLKAAVLNLTGILAKVQKDFGEALSKSLKTFANFIIKVRTPVLEYFFLPIDVNEAEK
jgi:hypothetical protein